MQQQRDWPRYTPDEVTRGRLVVLGREVFDLSRFAARHKGGAPAIHALQGTDATQRFLAAHAKSGLALRILQRVKVGEVDEGSLNAEDRDMARLEARFRKAGLFRYRRLWLALDLVRILLPFALGLLLARQAAPLAFALLCLAVLHHTYFAHDARHDAIFPQEQTGRRWVDLLGALVFGTTLNPLADEHRMHHAFTNCLDLDGALRVRPVVWHRRMLRSYGRRWIGLQTLLWLGVYLPMAYPYMVYDGTRYLLRGRRYGLLALIVLRFVLLGLWMKTAALLLVPQLLVSWFQALLSSLNHYHLKMGVGPEASSARTMIVRTQNTDSGAVWTWLSGGLNFHIEHHLFPTMPRRHYPRIAPLIEAYCRAHGIAYNRCSKWQAAGKMLRKLRHPLRPAAG